MCEITTNATFVLQRLQNLKTNLSEEERCSSIALHLHCQHIDRIIDVLELLIDTSHIDDIDKEWKLLFLRRLTRTVMGVERLSEYDAFEWEKLGVLETSVWNIYDNEMTCIEDDLSPQTQVNIWQRFLRVKHFEEELQCRKQEIHLKQKSRTTLGEMYEKYCVFMKNYLEKCISFHSCISVRGLTGSENVNHFFQQLLGLNQLSLTEEKRIALDDILEHIQIPLTLSAASIEKIECHEQLSSDNDASFFIPSLIQNSLKSTELTENITSFLKNDRWCVILGDPGCGKTTLLRWLMKEFATLMLKREKSIVLENIGTETKIYVGLPRIPILIRVGELVAWLDLNPSSTIIDYIGHQTWYGVKYLHEENVSILREFISHQHALILIDGLDEISDYRKKQRIVDLIDQFIENNIRSPIENILSNDDKIIVEEWGGIENERPVIVGGNQIIVTSRFIGYHIYPLQTKMLTLFSLMLIDEEFQLFLEQWLEHVHTNIIHCVKSLNLGVINQEHCEIVRKQKKKELSEIFVLGGEKIRSHLLLLSLACSIFYTKIDKSHLTSRIALFESTVKYALNSRTSHEKTILDTKILEWILQDIALYLHQRCPSGLIDTFDLTRLTELSLQSFTHCNPIIYSKSQLTNLTTKFIEMLDSNIGFVAARGLDAYGFMHLSFQEYFVALSIVNSLQDMKQMNYTNVTNHILNHMTKLNFHEPLVMTIDWIEWKWSNEQFDSLCNAIAKKYISSIPIGALFLIEIRNEFSHSVLKNILDCLLFSPFDDRWFDYLTVGLSKNKIVISFLHEFLQQTQDIERICRLILQSVVRQWNNHLRRSEYYLPPWISISFLWSIQSSNNISEEIETNVDVVLRSIFSTNTSIDIYQSDCLPKFLSEYQLCQSTIHPMILSVIIALCGGLYQARNYGEHVSQVKFSCSRMHCSTGISDILIEYFRKNSINSCQRLNLLRDQCKRIVVNASMDDLSRRVIDAHIALLCLGNIQERNFYQSIRNSKALSFALYRLKLVLYHLRQCYFLPTNVEPLNKSPILVPNLGELLTTLENNFKTNIRNKESFLLTVMTAYICLIYHESRRSLPILLSLDTKLIDILVSKSSQVLRLLVNLSSSNINEDFTMWNQNKHPYQLFRHYSLFPVAFLSSLFQLLFERLILTDRNIDNSHVIVWAEFFSCIWNNFIDPGKQNLILRSILLLFSLDNDIRQYDMDSISIVIVHKLNKNIELKFENIPKEITDFISARTMISIETEIEKQQKRICEAMLLPDQRETDLRLFLASISLAYLSESINASYELFEKIIEVALTIRDSVLRIICLHYLQKIVRRCIITDYYYTIKKHLFHQIEHVPIDIPLFTSVFLLIMFHEEEQFQLRTQHVLNNIFEKLNIKTENLDEEHDRKLIYQIIVKILGLETVISCQDMNQYCLEEILQLNSTKFIDYFQQTDLLDASQTLMLSQIYLTEIVIDAQHLALSEISSLYKTTSYMKKEIEQIWERFHQENTRFPHRNISLINIFLHSEQSETIHIPFGSIQSCAGFDGRDRPIIEEWLNYHTDIYRNQFAIFAVFLLIRQGDKIAPKVLCIVEMILEKSLYSNVDQIREGARRCFTSPSNSSHKTVCHMWSQSMWKELRKLYAYSLYQCFNKFTINSFEEVDILLELERQRLMSSARNSDLPQVSFLDLIKDYSANMWSYLEIRIHREVNDLTVNMDPLLDEYQATVLCHMIKQSREHKITENFRNLIISLVNSSHWPLTQLTIIYSLDQLDSGERILTEILNKQFDLLANRSDDILIGEELLSDAVFIACLRISLNFEINTTDDPLKSIWHDAFNSQEIRQHAAACYVAYRINRGDTLENLQEQLHINMIYVYSLYILIANYLKEKTIRLEFVERIVELLKEHWSKLIEFFIQDLYAQSCVEPLKPIYENPQPAIFEIANILVREKSEKFRQAIQESTIGEEKFKQALYSMSKKGTAVEKLFCIHSYAIFRYGTMEFIEMLFTTFFENHPYVLVFEVLTCFLPLHDRDLIESLFPYLKSSSMIHRYLAANWLVELVLIDILPAIEVHQLFQTILEDFTSQEILNAPLIGTKKSFIVIIRDLSLKMFCLKEAKLPNSLDSLTPTQIEMDYRTSREAPLLTSYTIQKKEDTMIRGIKQSLAS